MKLSLSILVVGGYGEFGGRISELLLLDGHTVHVAGRSYSKAVTFTQAKGGVPKAFDRQLDLAEVVFAEFDIVVDAAGPFQTYQDSGDGYLLAKRCIEQGVHYLDLSDDGYFAQGIKCLNDQAMAAGCVVLSGVSSTPALSSAVVDQLRDQMESLSVIETTILPGSNAPRGRSVMKSILGQVGNPMNIWRGCRWVSVSGWSGSIPVAVSAEEASARKLPVDSRKASFISTPDSVLFPAWFGADSVLFRAGLELEFMHSSLSVLGKLRRIRLLPSLTLLYKPLDYLASAFADHGTDRGGMVVAVTGQLHTEEGVEPDFIAIRRTWSLQADPGKGPYVAAAPVRAIINNIARIKPGARACLSELPLDDYLHATREIMATVHSKETASPVLLQQVLGSSWLKLPLAVKKTHLVHDEIELKGRGSVKRGDSIIARLVATVFRFPAVTADVAVSVIKRKTAKGEVWIRSFGRHRFQSTLALHSDVNGEECVRERFGLLDFELALEVSDSTMNMPVNRGWFLGLPIPKIFLPLSYTSEFEYANRMHFDVRLKLPFSLGLLVHYKGYLASSVYA